MKGKKNMRIRNTICLIFTALAVSIILSMSSIAAKAPLYTKNNVLVGANFNDGAGSSDMTLIIRLTGDGKIYVDEGSKVKYIHDPDNQNIKPGWTKIEYDDSSWKDGLSGVGFSDNDDNTQTPAGLISIWTRYYFDAPNASSIKELLFLVDYDDQYIAWLNGVEIARSGGAPGKAGEEPAWNISAGGVPNRGSLELVAGKPNEARWKNAAIEKKVVDFEFKGSSAFTVEPAGKLAATWGRIKSYE